MIEPLIQWLRTVNCNFNPFQSSGWDSNRLIGETDHGSLISSSGGHEYSRNIFSALISQFRIKSID